MKPPEKTPAPESTEIRVVRSDPAVGNGWDVLRGDTFLSFHRTEEAANKERDQLMKPMTGFDGWLILFVFGLGVQIVEFSAEAWTNGTPFVVILDIFMIALAGIAGIKLWRVRPNAVKWANIFLISSLVLYLLSLLGHAYAIGAQGIFYVAIWITYFKVSVRVKNTWPPKIGSFPVQKEEVQPVAAEVKVAEPVKTIADSAPMQNEPALIEHHQGVGKFVKVIAATTVALSVYIGLSDKPFSFLFSDQSIDQTLITQSVVNVLCSSINGKDNSGGSGTLITTDGSVITNSHVIPQNEKELLTTQKGCLVILPNSQNGQPEEVYWARPVVIPGVSDNYDLAYLRIYDVYVDDDGKKHGTFPRTFQSIFSEKQNYDEICRLNSNAKLGDPVRIYGYPQTSGGFNLTITDGIISTVASEGVILTSAKVDAGNSGGLAVDKKGCMVGIPTAVTQGKYQNLGVITATSRVLEFSDAVEKWSKAK
jgi:hypothetical protein